MFSKLAIGEVRVGSGAEEREVSMASPLSAAVTVDTDSAGDSYIVTIWLSANDSNALSVAMPRFQNVLLRYG